MTTEATQTKARMNASTPVTNKKGNTSNKEAKSKDDKKGSQEKDQSGKRHVCANHFLSHWESTFREPTHPSTR